MPEALHTRALYGGVVGGLGVAIRSGPAAVAGPVKAPEMQRYMKSDMPFLGVPKPVRAQALKAIFAAHPFGSREEWVAARQHSRVDPGWVRAFVEEHPALSGLSKREALKHI
nr:DNA alkylation repair protein [Saccharothrix deserti]